MCGRFAQTFSSAQLQEILLNLGLNEWSPEGVELPFSYNIAPSQQALAVLGGAECASTGGIRLVRAVWGFEKPGGASRVINARAETAARAALFRDALLRRRCLIPVSGFYEWEKTRAAKSPLPWFFTIPSCPIFCLAGLWAPGPDAPRFVIVTTSANQAVAPLHDRMPVILHAGDGQQWLGTAPFQPGHPRLGPHIASPMAAHRVSKAVNDPRHNSPDCIAPLVPEDMSSFQLQP